VVVIAVGFDADGMDEIEFVPHLVHHSPTGMEFGYAGSGPADLALSLLTFHLGAEPTAVKKILTGALAEREVEANKPAARVVRLYQHFKDEVLVVTTLDFLDLSGWGINQWIEMTERREAGEVKRRALTVGSQGGTT
jgi:hypothetical protein